MPHAKETNTRCNSQSRETASKAIWRIYIVPTEQVWRDIGLINEEEKNRIEAYENSRENRTSKMPKVQSRLLMHGSIVLMGRREMSFSENGNNSNKQESMRRCQGRWIPSSEKMTRKYVKGMRKSNNYNRNSNLIR